ncbi:MAG: nuclear transport factor 2 family protein [Anaerovoracaceae bacterium]
MDIRQKLTSYWQDIANQNAHSLGEYFITDAYIRWNNTNEHFTVQEFIAANCEYPGDWMGEIERIEIIHNTAITVTRVWLADNSLSFHVTSFFEFQGEKIAVLNEYWGDDGTPPQWRLDKHIGKPIK